MKKWLFSCVGVLFLFIGCEGKSPPPQGKQERLPTPNVIIEKEKEIREDPLPLEVKIRLRRDGKDNYSWEISGSDVNQILKVNEKLRRQLGGEQPR